MILLDLICISFLGVCSSCEEYFDPFGVLFFTFSVLRVTENGEVGYGTVTMRITGGQSVKIETTGRHIKLETNHRWLKCNYPL